MATKHVTHNGHKVFHNRGSQTPIKEHFPLQQISATKCSTTVALRHQKRNTFHLSHFQTPPRDHTMSLASTTFTHTHTQSGTVAVLGAPATLDPPRLEATFVPTPAWWEPLLIPHYFKVTYCQSNWLHKVTLRSLVPGAHALKSQKLWNKQKENHTF